MTDLPATRKEAQELGARRYFTGRPCSRGHISPRHTVNKVCVECAQQWQREWRPNNRESQRRTKAKYLSNHNETRLAHDAVFRAIRRGDLVRQNCEKCGKSNTHAHHEDYSRPLDVRWLCPECHAEIHFGPVVPKAAAAPQRGGG